LTTKKTVSIKDIAHLSGVSISTVSRVLNNAGRYSTETEKKVRQVIADTGYKPSIFAKGLRTNRTQNIGIVVPDITNEFFSSITLAIQEALFEKSYTAIICNTNEQPSTQMQQLEILRSYKVSGIIFISGEDVTEKDLTDGIPKVFVDRVPWNAESKDVVTVEVDNYSGGQLAAGELLDTGCRRIVALFDGRGLSTQVARYSGFLRAHQDRGIEVTKKLYLPVTQVSYEESYVNIKRLIADGVDFDGVFCYSDLLAYGAIRALSEAGISIPNQVGITGYDNVSSAQYCNPPLTTVEQPVEEMGKLAAKLILDMGAGKPLENRHHQLPVKLIRRNTTKKPV
jgi:LacI family transcriptional regulator